MRRWLLCSAALAAASPAIAADELKFGAPPAWVHPQPIPAGKATEAPISLLLNDQQTALERGKVTTFSEGALKIESEQGLAAGNLAFVWQPATDTVTINKLQIRRGDKIIDVLAGGQKFTVIRRETNLDAATLDGTLTATIQPEGLQAGDVIDFARTIERSDPVLKGHVEAMFGAWDGLTIQVAHAALNWQSDIHLQVRQTPNLPAAQKSSTKGMNRLELSATNVEPLIPPKGAPERFMIGRLAEATDFASWSDLATLFIPLFRDASTIPTSGPLHDEVDHILRASTDPKTRAEQALALVQDRVRYVALLMGQGGYVPALAETTWSRRFGDCKAKTALLLGILRSLGIEAEPVLVQAKLGDMIADRSPMIALFNHVLVRAHIGGRDYWLDGTRTGDSNLDSIAVPDFGWGLPLMENARLERMVPKPLDEPNLERHVTIDAASGIYAPAAVDIDELYRGDSAVELNAYYSVLTVEQRRQQLRDEAKTYFDAFTEGSSSLQFDKAKRELRITIKGSAKLNWRDGWLSVPTSSIAFRPDFERPAGPLHDVPWAIDHPRFIKDLAKFQLPDGFAAQQKLSTSVKETLAGIEYARSESVSGNALTVVSSERSITPEVSYKDALAAAPRLKALENEDVYLKVVANYRPTSGDTQGLAAQTPGSASEFVRRGNLYMDSNKFDQAISDFSSALELEPKNVWALADRGIAYVWTRKFDLADKDFAATFAVEPDNVAALRGQGLKAQFSGDCASAVEAYSKSLRKDPGNNFTVGHRAQCEFDLGRNVDALADAEAALKQDPQWAGLRLLHVGLFARVGQKDAAAREAELYVKDNPEMQPAAWVAVATAYQRAGMRDGALDAFNKVVAIKPEPSLYVAMAQLRPRSDYEGRMADLDAALKLEPYDPGALAAKAELLASKGDLNGALAVYERGIRAIPGQSPLSLGRALLLYRMGRKAEAERSLAAWRRGALTATELNQLCWGKAAAGILLKSAAKDCSDALHINPSYTPATDSLALVNLRLGKLDEAIALYDRAIAKMNESASYMGRALAYARKGDRARADRDRATALMNDAGVESEFAEYGLKFDNASQPVTSLY